MRRRRRPTGDETQDGARRLMRWTLRPTLRPIGASDATAWLVALCCMHREHEVKRHALHVRTWYVKRIVRTIVPYLLPYDSGLFRFFSHLSIDTV